MQQHFSSSRERAQVQNCKAKELCSKLTFFQVDLQVRTRLHLLDSLIMPILMHGCELWGYGNIEQTEVFHRNLLRRMLEIRKSAPKAMVYGELGGQEFKLTV